MISPRPADERLLQLACKHDRFGHSREAQVRPLPLDNAKWYRIRNRNDSPCAGGEELFRAGTRQRFQLALLERVCGNK